MGGGACLLRGCGWKCAFNILNGPEAGHHPVRPFSNHWKSTYSTWPHLHHNHTTVWVEQSASTQSTTSLSDYVRHSTCTWLSWTGRPAHLRSKVMQRERTCPLSHAIKDGWLGTSNWGSHWFALMWGLLFRATAKFLYVWLPLATPPTW